MPAYYPAWFFTCDAPRVAGNYGSFCDRTMDRLYSDSLDRFDVAGLQRDYSAMQRRLVRDVPFIALWQTTRIDVCRTTLTGCDTHQAWPVSVIERWRRTRAARAPLTKAANTAKAPKGSG